MLVCVENPAHCVFGLLAKWCFNICFSISYKDTEEFDSIVTATEKVNEQGAHAGNEKLQSELLEVTLSTEEGKKQSQSEGMNSLTHKEGTQGANQNTSALQTSEKNTPVQSFSSVLPKALSAVMNPAFNPQPKTPEKNSKPNLDQLQTELRDLRDQFEQMKIQHNKEIKLLMNELDEEKRIRLTLQMEIQRMKKHMSK
ncbi:SH3 domain-containing kinase-binding protein 1 isoform X2 [Austrofundulus limnaeus]|uniref:SH3 domain-containing kinase-binding protein 1 isoform X2 n=1 Tax=Austrofundulus limnaeus TaxID=52670 RepID=A0A2I4ASV1_AUSLI|nr:PREDICTED: SH3 domain-containing kinase-binding protein 1-like isoform X2 [Austrofundulus limnaeus]